MSGNAREISGQDVIAELREWAERFHHLAINHSLIALDGTEGNPHTHDGMAAAYGNASEFIQRRVDELAAEEASA